MQKKLSKFRPSVLALSLCALALSSCNRGVGCPTNFSLDGDVLLDLFVYVVKVIF